MATQNSSNVLLQSWFRGTLQSGQPGKECGHSPGRFGVVVQDRFPASGCNSDLHCVLPTLHWPGSNTQGNWNG